MEGFGFKSIGVCSTLLSAWKLKIEDLLLVIACVMLLDVSGVLSW
jgi:hypothetical protein